jgi:hypothetical protein
MAYIGSDDAAVYAINISSGKLRWRHTAGTSIKRTPVALDNDLYITSDREGLARLDRASGEAQWKIPMGATALDANPDADRFLAANDRLVYATDGSGRLVILDRKRGVKLSMLDTTAFRVPVVNDNTDRLYLAANDGLIVCLHDKDQKEPIRHRKSVEDLYSPVMKRLAQLVVIPGGKESKLRDALAELRKVYNVNFVIVQKAFKEAELPDPEEIVVKIPRTENKPLQEHLERLLAQAKATYQVVEQSILIVPAKPKDREMK